MRPKQLLPLCVREDLGINDNVGVLHPPQSSRTGDSPADVF